MPGENHPLRRSLTIPFLGRFSSAIGKCLVSNKWVSLSNSSYYLAKKFVFVFHQFSLSLAFLGIPSWRWTCALGSWKWSNFCRWTSFSSSADFGFLHWARWKKNNVLCSDIHQIQIPWSFCWSPTYRLRLNLSLGQGRRIYRHIPLCLWTKYTDSPLGWTWRFSHYIMSTNWLLWQHWVFDQGTHRSQWSID